MHDLDRFAVRPFISKMLGMGDVGGLLEKVQDLKLDNNPNLIKKLEQGVFTLRDMYEQLQNILKLGPLSKVMGMMPGFSDDMFKGSEAEASGRIKKFMVMMDSMCDAELDSDGKIFHTQPTRIVRVAIGSGTQVYEVEEMLAQFKKFAQLVKKMGGKNGLFKGLAGGLGGGDGAGPSGMNMARMQQQMNRLMQQNPQALRQMGGMGNIQNMMRQLQNGGGGLGGAMGDLMKKFGGGGGGL